MTEIVGTGWVITSPVNFGHVPVVECEHPIRHSAFPLIIQGTGDHFEVVSDQNSKEPGN